MQRRTPLKRFTLLTSLLLLVFVSLAAAERTDLYSKQCFNPLLNPADDQDNVSVDEEPEDYSSAVGTGKLFASPHKLFGEPDNDNNCFVSFEKEEDSGLLKDYSFTVCDAGSAGETLRSRVSQDYSEFVEEASGGVYADYHVFVASPRQGFEEIPGTVVDVLGKTVTHADDNEFQKGLYNVSLTGCEVQESGNIACYVSVKPYSFEDLKQELYSEQELNVEELSEDSCSEVEEKPVEDRTEEDDELLGECSDRALIDEAVELIEEKLAKDPFYGLMARGAFSVDKTERVLDGFKGESGKGKLLEVSLVEEEGEEREEGEMFLSPTNASLLLLYLENSDPAGDKLGLFDDQIAFAQYVLKVKGKVFSEPDILFEWSPYCSDNTEKRDFLGEYSALKEDAKIQSLIGALPAGVARTNYRDACENLGTENFGACSEEDYGLFYDLTGLEPGQREEKKLAYVSPVYYGLGSHELSLTGWNDEALFYSFFQVEEGEPATVSEKKILFTPLEAFDLEEAGSSEVMRLVEEEKACAKYSEEGITYFWNPATITEKAGDLLNPDTCSEEEEEEEEGIKLTASKIVEGGCTPSSMGVADPDYCPESPTFQAALFASGAADVYTATPTTVYAQEVEELEEPASSAIYFASDECCCGSGCSSWCYGKINSNCKTRYRGKKNYCGLNKCYECLRDKDCERKFSKAYGVCDDWKCTQNITCNTRYDCDKKVKDPLTGSDQRWQCVPGIGRCSVPCSSDEKKYPGRKSKCEYFMGRGFKCNPSLGYCESGFTSPTNLRELVKRKLDGNPYSRTLYGTEVFKGIDPSLDSDVLLTFGAGTKGSEFYSGLDYAKRFFFAVTSGKKVIFYDKQLGRDVMIQVKVDRRGVLSKYAEGRDGIQVEDEQTGKKTIQTAIAGDFLYTYPIEVYVKDRMDKWVLLDAAYGGQTWGDFAVTDLVLREKVPLLLLLDERGVMIPNYKLKADSGIYGYFDAVDSGQGISMWAVYNHPVQVSSRWTEVGGLKDVSTATEDSYNGMIKKIKAGGKNWTSFRFCHKKYTQAGFEGSTSCTPADADKKQKFGVHQSQMQENPEMLFFSDECYTDSECREGYWNYSRPVICKSDSDIYTRCTQGCSTRNDCTDDLVEVDKWICRDDHCIFKAYGECTKDGEFVEANCRQVGVMCHRKTGYCEELPASGNCCLFLYNYGTDKCYDVKCDSFVDEWHGGNDMRILEGKKVLGGDPLEQEIIDRLSKETVPTWDHHRPDPDWNPNVAAALYIGGCPADGKLESEFMYASGIEGTITGTDVTGTSSCEIIK